MSELERIEGHITTLLTEAQIWDRCAELGAEITERFQGQELLVIGVLKGVFPFYADLVRQIRLPIRCDFLGLSSYGSRQETSGQVRMTSDLSQPVLNRHVLVVEDIVDTGLTMAYLLRNLQSRSPLSVSVCALLHKPSRTQVQVPLDHVGFVIDDHFVVGYGLDFNERLRNLPYIGYFAEPPPTIE